GIYEEPWDGRVRVEGNLDAGQPHAGQFRQASIILPKGMDGRQIKLRAELDVNGQKRPARWACDHPTNPDGSLTIRLKKGSDSGWRKGVYGVHPKSETRDEGASYIEWRRTMLVPRQQYSRELKMAAMREIDSGKGIAEVDRMYQLSPKRLETWKGEWRAKGELAFPGKSARPQTKLDAERIAELERKIGLHARHLCHTLPRVKDPTWIYAARSNKSRCAGQRTATAACMLNCGGRVGA